jgi:hypothetical protein
MGGGAPVFRFGVDSEVTADGRFVGTGGTDSLLLKPISSADRRGGGAITLFARSFEACLWGNDGGSRVDCLGGNEGLAGRSTHHFSVTFSKSTSFELKSFAVPLGITRQLQTSLNLSGPTLTHLASMWEAGPD